MHEKINEITNILELVEWWETKSEASASTCKQSHYTEDAQGGVSN